MRSYLTPVITAAIACLLLLPQGCARQDAVPKSAANRAQPRASDTSTSAPSETKRQKDAHAYADYMAAHPTPQK